MNVRRAAGPPAAGSSTCGVCRAMSKVVSSTHTGADVPRAPVRSADGSGAARRAGTRRGIATRRRAGVRVDRAAAPPRRSTTRRSAVARRAAPRHSRATSSALSGSVVIRRSSTRADRVAALGFRFPHVAKELVRRGRSDRCGRRRSSNGERAFTSSALGSWRANAGGVVEGVEQVVAVREDQEWAREIRERSSCVGATGPTSTPCMIAASTSGRERRGMQRAVQRTEAGRGNSADEVRGEPQHRPCVMRGEHDRHERHRRRGNGPLQAPASPTPAHVPVRGAATPRTG